MTRDFPKNIIYKEIYNSINNHLDDYKEIDEAYAAFKQSSEFAWHKIKNW